MSATPAMAAPTTAARRLAVILLALLACGIVGPSSASASPIDRYAQTPALVFDQAERTVALGVSTPIGHELGKLRRFGERLGRMPATWTFWSWWGDPETRAFPTRKAEKVVRLGVTPMIWWEPAKPGSADKPFFPRFANTSAGKHDRYIRRWARAAKAFGRTILLRYAPESNGAYHPWTVGHFDNTPETFQAAWRHVWGIFREVGATNVKFVWSMAKKGCAGGCNPYAPFYPGDETVDYMAFSSFNWGAQKEGWKSMLQGFDRVTEHLTALSSRPIIAIESASNSEGGDKAAWIREGYPAVYAALPAIVAIVYLNADLRYLQHPDWRIASPPEAMTAYIEIAALPEFAGRFRKRSGGTIADALEAAPTAR